jgi:hypothetical protein
VTTKLRKQYKIHWDKYTGGQVACDSLVSSTFQEPDFVSQVGTRYWFGVMRSAGKDSKFMYLMDECPRTGALMCFNSAKLQWYIQTEEVQKAHEQWPIDKHFTSSEGDM